MNLINIISGANIFFIGLVIGIFWRIICGFIFDYINNLANKHHEKTTVKKSIIPDFNIRIPPPPKPTKVKDIIIRHNCKGYNRDDVVSNIVVWQFERLIRLEYNVDYFSGHPACETLYSRNTVTGIWHVKHKELCNTQK